MPTKKPTRTKARSDRHSRQPTAPKPTEFPKPPPLSNSDEKEMREISCLVRIREAVGDPYGKLMQDELVEKIRDLRNQTIEECAVQVAKAERGTKYEWVVGSLFEGIANSMAEQIRKLKTGKK